MDKTDRKILALLKRNSRLSNKEIGEQIYMTGQAVGGRITKLIEQGVIKEFTITVQHETKQFIRLFIENAQFADFEAAVNSFEEIDEFYKVYGQACYLVVAHFSNERLNQFIEVISKWAIYSIETVVANKKK